MPHEISSKRSRILEHECSRRRTLTIVAVGASRPCGSRGVQRAWHPRSQLAGREPRFRVGTCHQPVLRCATEDMPDERADTRGAEPMETPWQPQPAHALRGWHPPIDVRRRGDGHYRIRGPRYVGCLPPPPTLPLTVRPRPLIRISRDSHMAFGEHLFWQHDPA